MKVYFYTDSMLHPFYREQFKSVPEGTEYISSVKGITQEFVKKDIVLSQKIWSDALKHVKKTALRAICYLGVPNIRYIHNPQCDLIHSCQYPLLNKKSWVVDFEDVTAFVWYRKDVVEKTWTEFLLEQVFSSKDCKYLLPWTEAAKQSILNALNCKNFKHKIRVVYPCVSVKKVDFRKKLAKKNVKIMFVGTKFYAKGGLETLLAFDEISKRHPNSELVMISFVPEEIKIKYGKSDKIKFLSRIPNEELKFHYETSDIFVLPVHTDTLGFVFLEALSYGIPCIGTYHFAVPEIITDGVTGFCVKPDYSHFGEDYLPLYRPHDEVLIQKLKVPSREYVNRLAEKLAILIEDDALRLEMSKAAHEEVLSGRFSVERRRSLLKRIYEESLCS